MYNSKLVTFKLYLQKVVKISSVDMEDWEIYEESLNKPKEKRQTLSTKNMEV